MSVRGAFAAVCLVVGAAAGCADPGDLEDAPEEPPPDEPLDVTLDAVEVVHGALRVRATMANGSDDVSVRLGGDCDHVEVGGGLSTLSTLDWSFGEQEVADGIDCGFMLSARVWDSSRFLHRVASWPVTVEMRIDRIDLAGATGSGGSADASIDLARAFLRDRPLVSREVSVAISLSIDSVGVQPETGRSAQEVPAQEGDSPEEPQEEPTSQE